MKNVLAGITMFIFALLGCGKPAASSSINVATIQLPTLKCKTCVHTITNALASVDGVENAEVNLATKTATVKFIPAKLDVGKIELAISNAGYDADKVKRDSTAYENLSECCK